MPGKKDNASKGQPHDKIAQSKKADKLPAQRTGVEAHIRLMNELGIPKRITDGFRKKLLLCKTRKELDDTASRLKMTYFEEVWEP